MEQPGIESTPFNIHLEQPLGFLTDLMQNSVEEIITLSTMQKFRKSKPCKLNGKSYKYLTGKGRFIRKQRGKLYFYDLWNGHDAFLTQEQAEKAIQEYKNNYNN